MNKYRVNNKLLPGVTTERTMPMGSEMYREEIERDNVYIGAIVYVGRKAKVGTEYGWRPEKAHARSKLTNKVDAIRRLQPQHPPSLEANSE